MSISSSKPVIGLTGGIGSGKSLVARQLTQLGCAVIDADQLARQALDEPAVRDRLVAKWGAQLLDDAGRIDRRKLAAIVFGDPTRLRKLEALTHPRVHAARADLHRQYQADPAVKAIVEDCPLLLEVGLDKECDALIFVSAPLELRQERVARTRGWTKAELAEREKNQWPLDRKAAVADYVLANDADEDRCFSHVRGVFSQIMQQTA